MKKLVVFTGAGISQESGIKTFRDSGGLWEEYDIKEVATPEAWAKDPELVLEFYNKRRKQTLEAKPNRAHEIIAELEKHFTVQIITQNIDDLHERAGSTNVLHLHGEITKARSIETEEIYTIGNKSIFMNDLCKDGHQLRPHIVWFGEDVPNMLIAENIAKTADIFLIIGTSLNVYPAASLVHEAPEACPKYLVDPSLDLETKSINNLTIINKKAAIGLAIVASIFEKEYL
jgi:NAD-dependent deacetylase